MLRMCKDIGELPNLLFLLNFFEKLRRAIIKLQSSVLHKRSFEILRAPL